MRSLLAAVLASVICACAAPAQTLDQALEVYYQNRLGESLPLFRQLVAATPDDVEARAWLADNLRRTGAVEEALAVARAVLRDEPCHAHAHDVVAGVMGLEFWEPGAKDSVRAHVTRAVACDPDDGNLWLTYWMAALMRQDEAAERQAQHRVGELRFIPEPVMELARWMLRASPPDAVLFANGDWDYFPLVVAQSTEGLRPDVTVVLLSMMELPWYVRRTAARTGYPVPPQLEGVGDEELLADDEDNPLLKLVTGALWAGAWLEGRGTRPLVIASTAEAGWVRAAAWPRWDGPVHTLRPLSEAPADEEPSLDPDAFAALLPRLEVARLAGPLTHPSDRSPLRRMGVHPAEHVVQQLFVYGEERAAQGRMDEARRALSLMEELRATGQVRGEYLEMEQWLRETVEP